MACRLRAREEAPGTEDIERVVCEGSEMIRWRCCHRRSGSRESERDWLNIREVTDSTMTLSMGRSWVIPVFDSRIVVDRANSEIILRDRVFGFSSESRIPISQVDSVKMSTRVGRGYYIIPMVALLRTNPDARFDLWLEVRDVGKIHLDTRYGLPSDVGEIASLGHRIADFMQKPFIDTSRW